MGMSDLEQLKELKATRTELVEFRNKIMRLYKNPDFRDVFLKEYMVVEVARFMEVAGNPNQNQQQRADALQQAYAPGMLKRWLDARLLMGDTAEEHLTEIDGAILEEEQMEAMGDSGKYGVIGGEDDDDEGEGV
jgi:hypothetical protein